MIVWVLDSGTESVPFLLRILKIPVAPRRENLARIAAKNNQILLPRIWLAILHNLSRFCIGFLVFLLRGAVESGRILLPRFLARCIAMDGIVAPRSQFVDGRAQVQLRCGVVGCTWPVRERQHRRKKKKEKVLRWQFNITQCSAALTSHIASIRVTSRLPFSTIFALCI